ncbi:hypothetical protein B0H16DRAFT_1446540 [Mycena metata]|uniref:Uncharacterized protein n=1 Tax=Mycena metata TaxID=1033252 RepID=A0AAD7P1T5_9AGAR|nr:hypothetical protein B0H16DRAFT_1446540 [Mycena metata]
MEPISVEPVWTVAIPEIIESAVYLTFSKWPVQLLNHASLLTSIYFPEFASSLWYYHATSCNGDEHLTDAPPGLVHRKPTKIAALVGRSRRVKSIIGNVLALANNFVADSFFTYRCYVIWGDSRYKLRVIAVPLLLLVFTTIFGIANALLVPYPSVVNSDDVPLSIATVYSVGERVIVGLGQIVANLLLTGLTAGRIWCTRRNLRVIGETKLTQRCNTAVAILFAQSIYSSITSTNLLAST